MRKFFRILLKIIKNKYLLSLFVFFIWITFFDGNDLFSKIEMVKNLNKLKKEKKYFVEAIKQDKSTIKGLQNNNNQLEKFAREEYLMKRKNEDIFIILK